MSIHNTVPCGCIGIAPVFPSLEDIGGYKKQQRALEQGNARNGDILLCAVAALRGSFHRFFGNFFGGKRDLRCGERRQSHICGKRLGHIKGGIRSLQVPDAVRSVGVLRQLFCRQTLMYIQIVVFAGNLDLIINLMLQPQSIQERDTLLKKIEDPFHGSIPV